MQKLREQLDLINLKERIASNAKMSERLIKLLGQSKGWDELGRDWKLSRPMIRGLKTWRYVNYAIRAMVFPTSVCPRRKKLSPATVLNRATARMCCFSKTPSDNCFSKADICAFASINHRFDGAKKKKGCARLMHKNQYNQLSQ